MQKRTITHTMPQQEQEGKEEETADNSFARILGLSLLDPRKSIGKV
jgi:hypothetical protein